MKILLINNLYKPFNKGGAEAFVEDIALGLVSLGHQVILITLGREDKIEEIGVIKVYRIKPWNIFSFLDIDKKPGILRFIWWFFNVFNLSSRKKIKKILKQEKPDVVHMHNITGVGFLISRMIKKLKIKNILTIHDIQLAYPSGQLIYNHENEYINTFFLRKLYEKLVKYLINSPDTIISPSKWLLDFYTQKGFFKNSDKKVLPNSVSQTSDQRTESEKLRFLYVGQVGEYKGIFTLLNVFKDLDYELHIAGDGKDLEKAKEFKKDNIIFHGRLDKKELENIYSNSDILIFPSLTYENCPMAILRAFSFGMPVIGSRIGGVSELIEDNITGWLFEPGNEQELKELINISKDKVKEMRGTCLKKSEEYIIDKYLKKLEEMY
ncbi:MAG: glycosyltransferase family 4 protein [Patescibacteria group bacterium]